jgi:hypothetical protein
MRFLKDLLCTDTFMIKGHAKSGSGRLSNFLNTTRRPFLEMEEATLVRHDGTNCITTGHVQVRVNDILFAHELEVSGDESLRTLAERNRNDVEVTALFGGDIGIQISGKVRKRSLDSESTRPHDFIVVVEPRIEGIAIPMNEFEPFKNLPYAIVNRNRLALIIR